MKFLNAPEIKRMYAKPPCACFFRLADNPFSYARGFRTLGRSLLFAIVLILFHISEQAIKGLFRLPADTVRADIARSACLS